MTDSPSVDGAGAGAAKTAASAAAVVSGAGAGAAGAALLSPLAGNPLAGRDLLRLLDLEPSEFALVLATAAEGKRLWKADPALAQRQAPYGGRAVGVILEKPSLRTRVSFELAAARL
ncbi:MAG: hypothetical protein LBH64_02625, partial [Coriobacteriales bacterium]|nr:hypothetical protein [Coriobacteriales bacterium]